MGKISAVKTLLRSNQKISGAFGGIFDGVASSVENVIRRPRLQGPLPKGATDKLRMGMWDGIKEAHRGDPGAWDTFGGYSARKIAGSYMGVSAAGRIATGGGLYKDKDGNTDVIGVPLI
jgi:hypothetical protein